MRKLIFVLVAILVLAGAVAVYLAVSVPSRSSGVGFPVSGAQRALLMHVPASADTFALLPTAAAVQRRLSENPVTRRVLEEWTTEHALPKAWMLGGGDLLIWRTGKQTTLFLRLDPLRSLLARTYLMFSDAGDDAASVRVVLENTADEPIATADLDRLLATAAPLPAGDVFVVQRAGGRGAYPPVPRPAVSSVRITTTDISITSRAPRSSEPAATMPLQARFARSSILTVAFAAPSRAIEDMNRLVGARASTLLRDGGAIVLYDVDTNKLLPRPREVIVLPSTPERRAALDDFVRHLAPDELRQLAGFHIETQDTGSELLVAFERESIDRYLKDTFAAPTLPANSWSIGLDARRTVPMLQQVAGAPGLRYVAPRIFRSARDLGDWVEHLQAANFIEAADTIDGTSETLTVKIR